MDTKKLGMLGAIGSLAALPLGASAAVPNEPAIPPAQSYSDLLQPIANPVQRLQLADQQEAQLIPVQYYRGYDRRNRHHHHHHHHTRWWYLHNGYFWSNGAWVLRPRHHHHHHHHNHY